MLSAVQMSLLSVLRSRCHHALWEFTCVTTPAKCSNTDKQLYSPTVQSDMMSVCNCKLCLSICVSAKSPPVDPYLSLTNTFLCIISVMCIWEGFAQTGSQQQCGTQCTCFPVHMYLLVLLKVKGMHLMWIKD